MYIDNTHFGKITPDFNGGADISGKLPDKVRDYIKNNIKVNSDGIIFIYDSDNDDDNDNKMSLNVKVKANMFLTFCKGHLMMSKIPLGIMAQNISSESNISCESILDKHNQAYSKQQTTSSDLRAIEGTGNIFLTDDKREHSKDSFKGIIHNYGWLHYNVDRNYYHYLVYDSYRSKPRIYGNNPTRENEQGTSYYFGDKKIDTSRDKIIYSKEYNANFVYPRFYNGQTKSEYQDKKISNTGNDSYHINYNTIYAYESYYKSLFDSPAFRDFKIKGKDLNGDIQVSSNTTTAKTQGLALYAVVKGNNDDYYPWVKPASEEDLTDDPWFQSLWNVQARHYISDKKTSILWIEPTEYKEEKPDDYGHENMQSDNWPLQSLGINLARVKVGGKSGTYENLDNFIHKLFGYDLGKYNIDYGIAIGRFAMHFMNKEERSFNWSNFMKSVKDSAKNNIYVDTYSYKRYCNPDFWTGRLLSVDDVTIEEEIINGNNNYYYVLGQKNFTEDTDNSNDNSNDNNEGSSYIHEHIPQGDELLLLSQPTLYNQHYGCSYKITCIPHGELFEGMKIKDIKNIRANIIPTDEIDGLESKHLYYRLLINELTPPDAHSLISPELHDILNDGNIDSSNEFKSKYYDSIFSSANIDKKEKRREILANNNLYDIQNIADDFAYNNASITNSFTKTAQEIFKEGIVEDATGKYVSLNNVLSDEAISKLVYFDGQDIMIDTNIAIKGISGSKLENYVLTKVERLKSLFYKLDNFKDTAYNVHVCSGDSGYGLIKSKKEFSTGHRYQAMYLLPVELNFTLIFDNDFKYNEKEGDYDKVELTIYAQDGDEHVAYIDTETLNLKLKGYSNTFTIKEFKYNLYFYNSDKDNPHPFMTLSSEEPEKSYNGIITASLINDKKEIDLKFAESQELRSMIFDYNKYKEQQIKEGKEISKFIRIEAESIRAAYEAQQKVDAWFTVKKS